MVDLLLLEQTFMTASKQWSITWIQMKCHCLVDWNKNVGSNNLLIIFRVLLAAGHSLGRSVLVGSLLEHLYGTSPCTGTAWPVHAVCLSVWTCQSSAGLYNWNTYNCYRIGTSVWFSICLLVQYTPLPNSAQTNNKLGTLK